MKIKGYKGLFAFMLFCPFSEAQTWYQIGQDSLEYACPDLIEISGKNYEIRNECYGNQNDNYRLETGQVVLTKNHLRFYNREIALRSFIQDRSTQVILGFKRLAGDEIQLQLGQQRYAFIVLD